MCSGKLAAVAACAACGVENREGARFCDGCGARIGAGGPGGREQRKTVTAVFCDVVGSTALGESRDPEAMRIVLARYFERMRSIVEAHGGTVQKFIGDAVVAVFGVPAVHEDDALRALKAALEMRDALPELRIEARLGVNTGEVMTSADDTLVTGDAVNVAARLQQAAAPGEILVGRETWLLARGSISADEVAPIEAKGKAEPVVAFRLLDVSDAPERSHGSRFVGRAGELDCLREAWQRAADGSRCELVTITGEAGVGKSRLVAELAGQLGVPVVRGRCLSYGEGITYLPIVEVIRQLGGLPESPDIVAAIGPVLGESDTATSAEEIAWGFRKLIEGAAPLVVVFEDLHWAEETLLDLIEHLALLFSGPPLLVLSTARPELFEHRPAWPGRLVLDPLTERDVDELLPPEVPAELRQRIARAAGGNPLYLTEMMAVAQSAPSEIEVPRTLKALLAARLDQLDEAERSVLERGSVEGELFHRGAVQALLPGEPVTPRLAALARRELIRPDSPMVPAEDGFRFCHALVRDAAYDSLPKATRAELHEGLATWLEERAADLLEREELAAYHLDRAYRYREELGTEDRRLGDQAAALFVAAGRKAWIRADSRAAVKLLERALARGLGDEAEDVRVRFELALALGSASLGGHAMLAQAAARADATGDRAIAARARARIASNFSNPDLHLAEAQRACEEAIATLTELGDDEGLADVRGTYTIVLARLGRCSEAQIQAERAVENADACGDRVAQRNARGSLANNCLCHGAADVEQAIARCGLLLDSGLADRVLDAAIKRCLGLFHAMAGQRDLAAQILLESSAVLDDLNDSRYELSRDHAAYAKELLGDRAGAEDELKAMFYRFAGPTATRVEMRAVRASTELARLYCDDARWSEAAAEAAYWDGIPPADDSRGSGCRRLVVDARLAAHAGDLDTANNLAERALDRAEAREDPDFQGVIWAGVAEVRRAGGHIHEADQALATAIGFYEQKGNAAAAERLRPHTS